MAAIVAASATATVLQNQRSTRPKNPDENINYHDNIIDPPMPRSLSQYELQKRRDWIRFCSYLRNHCHGLVPQRCSGVHVLQFLKYLNQFGKAKVPSDAFPPITQPDTNLPADCPCRMQQNWEILNAIVLRLRHAFKEDSYGCPQTNPFEAVEVRQYLLEVRDAQVMARGIAYVKANTSLQQIYTGRRNAVQSFPKPIGREATSSHNRGGNRTRGSSRTMCYGKYKLGRTLIREIFEKMKFGMWKHDTQTSRISIRSKGVLPL